MPPFKEKTVLITGATGNLGKAVACAFDALGTRLVLVGSRFETLDAAYPSLKPHHLKLAADLTDKAAAARVVAEAGQTSGRIDAICAIAGGFHAGKPVHETAPADWDRIMEMNVSTMLNVVSPAIPGMIARKAGKIVTVGANSAAKGAANTGAYIASKSTVMRLTESMSAELRQYAINVNCVLPSTIDTPENRQAMPKADPARWVKPEDLAAVIVFLCSENAVAMHGALVPVVGLS
ncbi:SDR family NAD(P)-dependent oxidoreductase [Mesorhizobium sp. 1B3]|uniref:SDR family NAD(P)-dependent oxidoreductase n=1 Tax=Mesorhizobium sp. 1B3 TaxID=3243599 RepID=UPI003D9902F4